MNDSKESKKRKVYRKWEVAKHTQPETGIWVTYGDGVYDITTFVANHPGGSMKVMEAAGKSIEPFWRLYQQHYGSPTPMQILESLRIGDLHPDDVDLIAESMSKLNDVDPYEADPNIPDSLRVLQDRPINAEAPSSLIADEYITPNKLFFIRNHHPVPEINENDYSLSIKLLDKASKIHKFTLKELKENFPKQTITATIQCGGNRRSEMDRIKKTAGTPWKISAISNATWSGVLLKDVLSSLGMTHESIPENIQHIQFTGAEGLQASIPIDKLTMDTKGSDVLLAYEMNGETLPREHGYPVRVVVPGTVGVRNVKWVTKIKLSEEEAEGPWQRGMAYKGFNPSIVGLNDLNVESIPSVQEQPVTSAISVPQEGDTVRPGNVKVKGYAYSGGGRGIIRVDVSADGGKTWHSAKLKQGSEQPLRRAWAWTLWECVVPISPTEKKVEIVSKAIDSSHNVQPDSLNGIWNLRGINNNAWHRVGCKVKFY